MNLEHNAMRILVVEDEHKIANSIKKGLEQEGYVVDVAFDGESALDIALSEKFDAIVLDIMLPGIDGLSVCTRIRSEGIHTPILMLTAKGQIDDKVTGLDAGADDYLTKPFAFAELVARVRALGRRPKQQVDNLLQVDNLTLNSATFEVKRSGVDIALSRKEYSLLELLMRHPEKIVTKESILAGLWSWESDVLPNTVEVYIGYLRKKIDMAFPNEKPLISTVRGFGYKIGNPAGSTNKKV